MADYIPFEIQTEIMKRLPTKSLMRFRSVSKPYKSLIDSSKFIIEYSFNHAHQEHLLVSFFKCRKQNYVTFVVDDSFPPKMFSLPDPEHGLIIPTLVGSSQGVLCLRSKSYYSSEPRKWQRKVVLWNPSIRKSVVIVVPNLSDQSEFVIGFGVCPHTRDPKIVYIDYNREVSDDDTKIFTPWKVHVYTLSSGAWKSIPTITQPRNSIQLTSKQVVTDEYIYWLATDFSSHTLNFVGYNMIVSFDLTNEKFMEVSLPDTLATVGVAISKLNNSLVMLEEIGDVEIRAYGVWMMDRGHPNTFTKLFTINSPDALVLGVCGFRKNDEPIFFRQFLKNDERIFGMTTDEGVLVQKIHSEHISCDLISIKGYQLSAWSFLETLLLFDH